MVHRSVPDDASVDAGRDRAGSAPVPAEDSKSASVLFGASVGALPSWVPVYPGSEGHATFTVTGNGEGGAGDFAFVTSDSEPSVTFFYAQRCRDMGMKVSVDTTTLDAGTVTAEDEGGERRSLTVEVRGHSGQTTVNVTYGLK
jgi:hypothetical protein